MIKLNLEAKPIIEKVQPEELLFSVNWEEYKNQSRKEVEIITDIEKTIKTYIRNGISVFVPNRPKQGESVLQYDIEEDRLFYTTENKTKVYLSPHQICSSFHFFYNDIKQGVIEGVSMDDLVPLYIENRLINIKNAENNGNMSELGPLLTVFEAISSPLQEEKTGFELEEFLKQRKDFSSEVEWLEHQKKYPPHSSQIEKIDEAKKYIEQQLDAVMTILNNLENENITSTSIKTIFENLPQNKHFALLSQEQKYFIKRGILRFHQNKERMDHFFQKYETYSPNEQAALLRGCDPEDISGDVSIEKSPWAIIIRLSDGMSFSHLFRGSKSSQIIEAGGFFNLSKINTGKMPVIGVNNSIPNIPETYKQEVIDHETQHAKNHLYMNHTYDASSRKDEIIAFLKGGRSLSHIKELFFESNLYANIKPRRETWEQHKKRTGDALDALSKYREVDLTILSIFPMRHWKFLLDNNIMDSILRKDLGLNIVEIKK